MNQTDTGVYKGHRERMRQKLKTHGTQVFETYELLEMLLYHAIPRKNTHPTAKLLLKEFKTLGSIFSKSADELTSVNGVGIECAKFIQEVAGLINSVDLKEESHRLNFSTWDSVGEFFKDYFKGKEEAETLILLLDADLNYINLAKIYSLDMSSGAIQAKPFVDVALKYGAVSCVIAHNHPHGSAFPTDSDWETAKMLKSAFVDAGLNLLDCFVVNEESYKRFAPQAETKSINSPKNIVENAFHSGFESRIFPLIKRLSNNPEELRDKITKSFGTATGLFESDSEKIKLITKSDSLSELFTVIGALASRKAVENFSFGKAHKEEEITGYLKGFYLNVSREIPLMLPVGDKGEILGAETFFSGTVNFSSLTPRIILEKLAFFKSECFILAHNHPGGVAEESEEDVRATISLDNALKTCGVSIKAHYVIASSECNEIKFREK